MNSIIDNQIDQNWFKEEELNKCLNSKEYFYNNYCVIKNGEKIGKPVLLSDNDKFLFDLFDKAEKEGKELVQIRGRNRTYYGFIKNNK